MRTQHPEHYRRSAKPKQKVEAPDMSLFPFKLEFPTGTLYGRTKEHIDRQYDELGKIKPTNTIV